MTSRFSLLLAGAAFLCAPSVLAQSRVANVNGSTDVGPWVDMTGTPLAVAGGGAVTLTHSTSQTITALNSVSCNAGGLHTDNSYYRVFNLNAFGVQGSLTVNNVDIGIESAVGAVGAAQPASIRFYTYTGAVPAGALVPANMVQVGATIPVIVTDAMTNTVATFVTPGITVPANSNMVVEFFTPNGQTAGNRIFIGSNGLGQTGPTYLAAADCGIAVPTPTATIGFPNMHWVLNVDGVDNIPVELTSFTGTADGTSATLAWATSSETNNAGFEVQQLRGSEWTALGFVTGNGTTTEAQSYSYRANGLAAGTHSFRLRQVDFDGAFELTEAVEVTVGVPGTHALSQAYPNPFNPQASFDLSVASTQNVRVELFNAIGQRVQTLFEGTMEGGQTQQLRVDGSQLSSGLYVARVTGATFSDAITLSLLK